MSLNQAKFRRSLRNFLSKISLTNLFRPKIKYSPIKGSKISFRYYNKSLSWAWSRSFHLWKKLLFTRLALAFFWKSIPRKFRMQFVRKILSKRLPVCFSEYRFRSVKKVYLNHHRPAVVIYGHKVSQFHRKRSNLIKKHSSVWNRMLSLHRATMKGRRYDYPGRRERFRWPARVNVTTVIDPADIWEILRMKTLAFARVFRVAHSSRGLLENPSDGQIAISNLVLIISKDYLNQEEVFPLTKAPLFLFDSSFSVPAQLFAVFWQEPTSPIDCDSFFDNFYSHSPTVTIWLGLVQRLLESPSSTSHLLLWDFAARELAFWTQFFNEVKTDRRLSTDNLIQMLTHPTWLYQQLIRLALAAPFFPSVVRSPLLKNFISLVQLCRRLTVADKARLSAEAFYGPLNELRMNSWFRRQTRYLKDQLYALNHLPHYIRTCRLLKRLKICRQLHRLAPWIPAAALRHLLNLGMLFGSLSLRFRQFSLNRRKSKRRWWRRRLLSLADKELCRNAYGETHLSRKRRKNAMSNIRPGGIYVAFNKSFLWNLLLLWLVSFFRRIIGGARGHYLTRWILLATSDFSLALVNSRPWSLIWATIGIGRFIFTNNHYRLACLHWVKPIIKPKRKAYFRRWFTGFFYRKRKTTWRFRPRIPRYYRRFQFIRRLPFSTFRTFWPQSANFIRSRFTPWRNYRRSAKALKRRPLPTSFKLIQPRSTYKVKRTNGPFLTQLTVSRHVSV